MNRPSKRLRLLRIAAASPRQTRLKFAVQSNDACALEDASHDSGALEDANIPLGQPSPVSSEEAAGPPCGVEEGFLQNDSHDNLDSSSGGAQFARFSRSCALAAGPSQASPQHDRSEMERPPPSYWASEPPVQDMRVYRGGENNAARLGQEYNLVVQLLFEAWVLPDISVRTQDEVQENLLIAQRYLEDITFFLRGWPAQSDFDSVLLVRLMLNRALKMKNICKHAARESKAAAAGKAAGNRKK